MQFIVFYVQFKLYVKLSISVRAIREITLRNYMLLLYIDKIAFLTL
jgi:hypothetical protein